MALTDSPPARSRQTERHILLADLERAADTPAVLVVVSQRPDDERDGWMLDADDSVGQALSLAAHEVAHAHAAQCYRLDRLVFAVLGPPNLETGALVMGIRLPVDHGVALLPADGTGAEALRIALERMRWRARRHAHSVERQVRNVLLGVLAERQTPSSAGAAARVADLAIRVGRRLGLGVEQLDTIVRAAELQDLGKMLLPDLILRKREAPTADEWEEIRRHPLVAERIVGAAPAMEAVAHLVRSCNERYDGKGYPDGLAGERIPLGARVIAVCVAFDAMITERPYRAAVTDEEALAELGRCAGLQFDPMVVDAFSSAQMEL